MLDQFSGRCLCGAVQYELAQPLGKPVHCHCRSCRLSHGAAFVTWTSVPMEQFKFLRGEFEVSWFCSSPGVRWGFCRACGSSMLYIADRERPDGVMVNHVYVTLGSLMSQVDFVPIAHVSYEEHMDWIEDFENLPKFHGKSDEWAD